MILRFALHIDGLVFDSKGQQLLVEFSGYARSDWTDSVLKAPRDTRETFILLARLEEMGDLDAFLDEVDWGGVGRQQISCAVLGQLPLEVGYTALVESPFDAKAYFKGLILGEEFQTGIVATLLNAFPELPRRFFIHVPKSGGTSVNEILQAQASAVIYYSGLRPDWAVGRKFIDEVAKIARAMRDCAEVHICGHYTLRTIVQDRLVRFGDTIWTIVRPPRETLISLFNYILTTLESDPALVRPDSQYWARHLTLAPAVGPWSRAYLQSLLPQLLAARDFVPADVLCHFLGDGTLDSALDLLAISGLEVVDHAKLDEWLRKNWNVAKSWRGNVSKPFLRISDLSAEQHAKLDGFIRQDVALYGVIQAAMGDAVSVSGERIAARAAAVEIADGLPAAHDRDAFRQKLARSFRGWSRPPMKFQTIETTLSLPLLDAQIRLRYARHQRGGLNAALRFEPGAELRRVFGRISAAAASFLKPTSE